MTDVQSQQRIVESNGVDKFPCKSCGGKMIYDPESTSLLCPYCGSKAEITRETMDIKEYNFSDAENNENCDWGVETRVVKCDSCGAETVIEANSIAQFCAFCGSPQVVKDNKSAGIAPESLIPFKISEKSAKQLFTNWVKERFFAPKALKSNYQMERLKGVYIPCWTYDSNTFSNYTAEGGTYYYEQETEWVEENGQRIEKTKQVRKVRWWPTSGDYSKFFNDIPVPASKQIDNKLMSELEPFNREELVPYKPEYLSGFLAERSGVSLKEGWEQARQKIDYDLKDEVTKKINADEVRNLNINTTYSDVKYKLTLNPVWISAFKFKNKTYVYMINGQNGEVAGRFPLSVWKVIISTLITCGIIGIITLLTGGIGAILFPFAIGLIIFLIIDHYK